MSNELSADGRSGWARGDRRWIAVTYFLFAAAPGCWFPVLSSALEAQGWGEYKTIVFLTIPISGLLSPLTIGAFADQRFPAEKVLAFLVGGGSIFLWLAFDLLEKANDPRLFIAALMLNGLISGPCWSLINSIAFSHLPNPSRDFGRYRVWATFGWMGAGLLISGLALDASPQAGKVAVWLRLLAFGAALMLPITLPKGKASASLSDRLGLGAFKMLRQRDIAVYALTASLITIPISAFYLHTPLQLKELGLNSFAGGMTIGQLVESVAMIGMGALLLRFRLKWLFVFALVCGVLRYAFYAMGAHWGSWQLVLLGVALNGISWALFFEAGRVFVDRRVEQGMRSQSQALLGILSGGIASIIGTWVVGVIYKQVVETEGGAGWVAYWLILTAMCVVGTLIFIIGYKGDPAGKFSEKEGNKATGSRS